MNKKKADKSGDKTDFEKKVIKCRNDISNYATRVMEANKLDTDTQMAVMLFVTIEKCMEIMDLHSLILGAKAVSILVDELIHEVTRSLEDETDKRNQK